MKQVIQNFKTGELSVDEVPAPSLSPGFALIQNHYSLISAGTERSTVSTAKASLLKKAQQRPDLVKQVMDTFKREGLAETWKRVRTKLETLKELGYSSAGTLVLSLDSEGSFKPGDRVACAGGGYASHAGLVSVPQNLIVKVPDSVPLSWAAFTALGSISMQGVRQANPKIGELVCVIGLGLVGQITAQILRANGCQVFGIDTSESMVQLGLKMGCHRAFVRNDGKLEAELDSFTDGYGFDSVIITAATQSVDPIELSLGILRQRGTLVIVGAVPMNIPRDPHFYRKELQLKISCSYGPGRYDYNYEEGGHDYPYGYVRWTEKRNMAAFVRLLEDKSVNLEPLITHVFNIDEAEKAYAIVTGAVKERHVAILLKYPDVEEKPKPQVVKAARPTNESIGIGFIGAGSFAQKYLIPNARRGGQLCVVATSHGVTAKNVATKFEFPSFSTDVNEVFSNPLVNAVFIATRHNTHADLTVKALQAGKNVFVEKPLTILEDDLPRIVTAVREQSSCILLVGFNRRFAPLAKQAKLLFTAVSEPLVINYRVNAGFIPKNHWTQTEEGGGRILGEVCHFVDLLQFLTDSIPIKVSAESISTTNGRLSSHDNLVITIRFANGSVGAITYAAGGDKLLSKERIEVLGGGKSFIIDDFKEGALYDKSVKRKIKLPGKGYGEEIELFLKAIREGLPSPISFESICYTTKTTFQIVDALQTGLPQEITIT